MSSCPTIRSSTCCPSDNANIYGYKIGDNTTPPLPVITCPVDFNGWMTDGEYEIPDFTSSLEVCAACQELEDLTITQEPPAGTVITVLGGITIVITVVDSFGRTVTCSFIITVNEPPDDSSGGGGGGGTDTPTLPPWVYTPGLFAYWTFNDTLCTVGALDEAPPCWFRRDLTGYLGNASPRHLSNAGGAVIVPLESAVDNFGPGPTFHTGSVYSNNSSTGYLFRADDTTLRMIGASFTMRGFFKLIALDPMESWQVFGKFSTLGYRIIIRRPDASAVYTVTAEMDNGTSLLTIPAQPFTINTWIYVAMVFDSTLGRLRLYIDGVPMGTDTEAGFVLAGEASQFRVGSGDAGAANVVSCWALNDLTWEDAIGGRHLVQTGTVNSVAGKISNCASFPITTGGKLSYGTDPALGLVGTDFSVRIWVRIPSASSNPGQIIGKYGSGSGWRIHVTGPAAPYQFEAVLNAVSTVSPSTLAANIWYHITITYKLSTNTLKIYLDSVLVQTAIVAAHTLSADDFFIGMTSAFVGPVQLDEAQIWSKELSGAEIIADYNAGTGTSCSSVATTASIYVDELGVWLGAWSDARVAEDYAILEPYLT